jgi:hypothetical protein
MGLRGMRREGEMLNDPRSVRRAEEEERIKGRGRVGRAVPPSATFVDVATSPGKHLRALLVSPPLPIQMRRNPSNE